MSAIDTSEPSSGRSLLVTGGTSGLGRHLVSALAGRGWQVVFTRRDVAAGASLEKSCAAKDRGSCHFLAVDQSDLIACAELPGRIDALGLPPLAAIVCNAAMQGVGSTVATAQGLEATFALNHLSHHLLVELLLPALQDRSRILVVASGVHDPAQRTGMPAPEFDAVTAMAALDFLAGESPGRTGRPVLHHEAVQRALRVRARAAPQG